MYMCCDKCLFLIISVATTYKYNNTLYNNNQGEFSLCVLGRCVMNNNNIIITSAQEYCYAGMLVLYATYH